MNVRTVVLSTALSVLMVLSARAQDAQLGCANPITQGEMNVCAASEFDRADAQLNEQYESALKAMQASDQQLGEIDRGYVGAVEALKRAQRGWIDYRDGQCQLAGFEARGGSMEPMLVSLCLADLTRKRTQELKDLLSADGR